MNLDTTGTAVEFVLRIPWEDKAGGLTIASASLSILIASILRKSLSTKEREQIVIIIAFILLSTHNF